MRRFHKSGGPLVPHTKDWVEEGWGSECFAHENIDVLVALPYSADMKHELIVLMLDVRTPHHSHPPAARPCQFAAGF